MASERSERPGRHSEFGTNLIIIARTSRCTSSVTGFTETRFPNFSQVTNVDMYRETLYPALRANRSHNFNQDGV